jgi:hypothetical protein
VCREMAAGKLPPSAAPKLAGEHTARVTPVPIPNTEVKPRRADGTARVSVWEIRSSPALNSNELPTPRGHSCLSSQLFLEPVILNEVKDLL